MKEKREGEGERSGREEGRVRECGRKTEVEGGREKVTRRGDASGRER